MVGWNLRARYARAGALLAAVALCATAPAAAEVRVSDAGGGRLVIEAHDATVQQILDAVAESRPVRFKASEALSRHVTGTYRGTLPRVLSRVLDGYDHVIRSSSDGIRIDVVGAAQGAKFTGSVANSVAISGAAHVARGQQQRRPGRGERPAQTRSRTACQQPGGRAASESSSGPTLAPDHGGQRATLRRAACEQQCRPRRGDAAMRVRDVAGL